MPEQPFLTSAATYVSRRATHARQHARGVGGVVGLRTTGSTIVARATPPEARVAPDRATSG